MKNNQLFVVYFLLLVVCETRKPEVRHWSEH